MGLLQRAGHRDCLWLWPLSKAKRGRDRESSMWCAPMAAVNLFFSRWSSPHRTPGTVAPPQNATAAATAILHHAKAPILCWALASSRPSIRASILHACPYTSTDVDRPGMMGLQRPQVSLQRSEAEGSTAADRSTTPRTVLPLLSMPVRGRNGRGVP